MGCFGPEKHTEIFVDASPTGISAILAQYTNESGDGHIVAYASHALSQVEQRYPQIDREGLAVIWACEHYHIYIYGKPVTVITDHKPLVSIYNNPKSKPPLRLERFALRLEAYQATVEYRPGVNNPADYLSRYVKQTADPNAATKCDETDNHYVNFVAAHAVPKAMTMEEIKTATLEDPTLQEAARRSRNGRWHDPCPEGVDNATLASLKNVRDELTVFPDDDLILRDTRIVIPQRLQARTLAIAHEGHQGLVKTKQLLREKVWFAFIDKKCETMLKDCLACQAVTPVKRDKSEPMKTPELPSGPWQELSADFWGPTPDDKYLLVVIDEYSRFPVVKILNSIGESSVIPVLDKLFAMLGTPHTLKTDNGAPFQGDKFRQFADYIGFVRVEDRNWQQEIHKFLRNYRATPHSSTPCALATLLLNREMRIKLPDVRDFQKTDSELDATARRHDDDDDAAADDDDDKTHTREADVTNEDENDDNLRSDMQARPSRERKQPTWMKDYV